MSLTRYGLSLQRADYLNIVNTALSHIADEHKNVIIQEVEKLIDEACEKSPQTPIPQILHKLGEAEFVVNSLLKQRNLPLKKIKSLAPLFLIPSILGTGAELFALAEELSLQAIEKGIRQPIYIYFASTEDSGESLQGEGHLIAKEIARVSPEGPHFIAGYSYGCAQAVIAAQNFDNSFLYLIDGPSASCSQQYFVNKSEEALEDIFSIVKYAARLSFKDSALKEIALTQEEKKRFSTLPLNECLEKIAEKLTPSPINAMEYKNFRDLLVKKVDRGLHNILGYQKGNEEHLKDQKTLVLLTDKTATKYQDRFGGWGDPQENPHISFVSDPHLLNQNHLDLLRLDEDAQLGSETTISLIAKSMLDFVEKELKPAVPNEKELATTATSTKGSNPDLLLAQELTRLLEEYKARLQNSELANQLRSITNYANTLSPADSSRIRSQKLLTNADLTQTPPRTITPPGTPESKEQTPLTMRRNLGLTLFRQQSMPLPIPSRTTEKEKGNSLPTKHPSSLSARASTAQQWEVESEELNARPISPQPSPMRRS